MIQKFLDNWSPWRLREDNIRLRAGQRVLRGSLDAARHNLVVAAVELQKAADNNHHLLDCAETLLCNANPQSHCTQADWDRLIKDWRDAKNKLTKI